MKNRINLQHIDEAARIIDPIFLNTPQFRCEPLENVLGCQLLLKIETMNPTRSFKGRGACYAISKLPKNAKVVCASAGNLGQAMAYACRTQGIPLIVYASKNANPLKIQMMRSFGAEVRLVAGDLDDAGDEAERVAVQENLTLIKDSLEVATCEGAGTIGKELLNWPDKLDIMLVALGGGAMLTGIGTWIKAKSPETLVIGIVAEGAPAMEESWRQGKVIEHTTINTIADGIAGRIPIPEVLEDMKSTVDDVLRVSDEALIAGMKLLFESAGIVTEPSGACGVAAILSNKDFFRNKRVASVICGGNLTPEQMRKYLF
ncbi:MAG TPA: threonine/serine dehydratase [Candidatus Saccharimonadales bacterium]